jgi:hypothetical protein
MVAAFGFLAETWGHLSLSLLRLAVTTGSVHFTGVCYSLALIYMMEVNIGAGRGPPKYHIRTFVIPAFLLLAGWAMVGVALTDAAWWAEPKVYYGADKSPACKE